MNSGASVRVGCWVAVLVGVGDEVDVMDGARVSVGESVGDAVGEGVEVGVARFLPPTSPWSGGPGAHQRNKTTATHSARVMGHILNCESPLMALIIEDMSQL